MDLISTLRLTHRMLCTCTHSRSFSKESTSWFGSSLSLAFQAMPSLIISVIGLVIAGELMDRYKHWDTFLKYSELFILLPVLLNLKGNLEMNLAARLSTSVCNIQINLAARLSTSSNLGDLDYGPTRRSLIVGNLALLQIQSILASTLAGLTSFGIGCIIRPETNMSYYEMMYTTASSVVSTSFSSVILGIFMSVLIIGCRKFGINPDNIACPLVSSSGDIVTLILLGLCSSVFQHQIDSFFNTFVFLSMISMIPVFGYIVYHNSHVKKLLFTGWTPIIVAMIISSLAGVVLETFVEQYKAVALMTPVLIGLAGNFGSIYVSRIGSSLHMEFKEDYKTVEYTMLVMNILLQVVFLFVIWMFRMGEINYTFWFFFTFIFISVLCTWFCLKIGRWMALRFWKMGYDPDIYVIPYLTASIDVIGTLLLVLSCSILECTGDSNLKVDANSSTNVYA